MTEETEDKLEQIPEIFRADSEADPNLPKPPEDVRDTVAFNFSYKWEPFTSNGHHLTFNQHCEERLERANCSHWGSAIYKWEGPMTKGPHAGKPGILIGETGDLRQRIKQYISGTQESGNKYWREAFLSQGNIRLFILIISEAKLRTPEGESSSLVMRDLESNNARLVFEQLLVMREIARADENRWLVNRKV